METDKDKKPLKKEPIKKYELKTVESLMLKDFPEQSFVVDRNGLKVPEGITLFCGAAKIGKSWLILAEAIAAANNGIPTLYLALEDTERRLQERLKKLNIDGRISNFYYDTKFEKLEKNGLDKLESITKDYGIKLLIIDTLQKIRPSHKKTDGGGAYSQDYDAISQIKTLADASNFSIIFVHHQRKMPDDDIFNTITGSTGLTGAVDTLIVLERIRGNNEAVWHITGRDVEENKIALLFDSETCTWQVKGDPREYELSKEQRLIIEYMKTSSRPLSPKEIALALDRKDENVRQSIRRMLTKGIITQKDRGLYEYI